MHAFIITITVDIPYPKQFEYREMASGFGVAISRAIRKLRKALPRKQLRTMRVSVVRA